MVGLQEGVEFFPASGSQLTLCLRSHIGDALKGMWSTGFLVVSVPHHFRASFWQRQGSSAKRRNNLTHTVISQDKGYLSKDVPE